MQCFNHLYKDASGLTTWMRQQFGDASGSGMLIQLFSGNLDETFLTNLAGQIMRQLPEAVLIGTTTGGEIAEGRIYENQTVISFSRFEKTLLNNSVVLEIGFSRILASSWATKVNKPTIAFCVAYPVKSGFTFCTKGSLL